MFSLSGGGHDPKCPERYINEANLCILLQEFVEANHKKIRISDKLQVKVEKHYGITKALLDHYKLEQELDIPFVEYARYVLTRGTESEKTAFANGITTKLQIKESQLGFQDCKL